MLVGLAGLVVGRTFLENVLPLGTAGEMDGAGTIEVLNVIVGIEIAAGFVVLLTAFIEETLRRRLRREQR